MVTPRPVTTEDCTGQLHIRAPYLATCQASTYQMQAGTRTAKTTIAMLRSNRKQLCTTDTPYKLKSWRCKTSVTSSAGQTTLVLLQGRCSEIKTKVPTSKSDCFSSSQHHSHRAVTFHRYRAAVDHWMAKHG